MNFFSIKANGRFLDIGENKITFEFHNSLVAVGIIRDDFTYSFKIPYTSKNLQILGMVGYVESQDLHQDSLPCELYIENQFWYIGELFIQEAVADEYITIKISFVWAAFSKEIGDKKIADLYTVPDPLNPPPFPYYQDLDTSPTNYRYYFVEVDWNRPLYPELTNPGPERVYIIKLNGVVVAAASVWDIIDPFAPIEDLADSFNNDVTANQVARAYARDNKDGTFWLDIVPFLPNANLDLVFVITDYPPDPPEEVLEFPFTYYDETKPVMAQNYAHIRFPHIKTTEFYGNGNPSFIGELNKFVPDATGVYLTNSIADFAVPAISGAPIINRYAHCPCIFLHSIITHITASVGWSWEGDFKDDTELATLLIYSNYASDQLRRVGVYEHNEHARRVYFKDIVPDLTIKQFFEQIQEMFGLYYDFDSLEKVVKINFKKDVFPTLPSSTLKGEIAVYVETLETKNAFKIAYDENLDIRNYYQDSAQQGTFKSITTQALSVGAMPYTQDFPAYWEQKGNSPMFGVGERNNRKMYLFFFRGYQLVNKVTESVAEASGRFGESLAPEALRTNYWLAFYNYQLKRKPFETIIGANLNFLKQASKSLARIYDNGTWAFVIEKIQMEIDANQQQQTLAKLFAHKLGL